MTSWPSVRSLLVRLYMKLELLSLGLVLGGCFDGIPDEDGEGIDEIFEPNNPGGGIPCPPVEFPQAFFMHVDDDVEGAEVRRVAVGGLYELRRSESGSQVSITTHGGLSVDATTNRSATLRGDVAGPASIELTASGGKRECHRTTTVGLDVAEATNVTLVPALYTPLAGRSIAFFDAPEFDLAVRLSDDSGEPVVDTTLVIGGVGVAQTRFDRFSLIGGNRVDVEADSFRSRQLVVETVSAIDGIELEHSLVDDSAFPHRVCAHALAGEREVALSWSFTLEGLFPFQPNRNCVAISQANVPVRVVATAPDGKTASFDVR